uniref:Uncharacterized protein n=1 Tax=Glossina palpalis gambiensis TaxID=67801 RepID=A0A1B0BHZ7_9MUSC
MTSHIMPHRVWAAATFNKLLFVGGYQKMYLPIRVVFWSFTIPFTVSRHFRNRVLQQIDVRTRRQDLSLCRVIEMRYINISHLQVLFWPTAAAAAAAAVAADAALCLLRFALLAMLCHCSYYF